MNDPLTVTIQVIQALALLVLGLGGIMLALVLQRMKRSLDRVDGMMDRLTGEARPVLDRARAIGENVNHIVMSVRKDVEQAGETVDRANERLEAAIEAAEVRVREFSAVLGVAQTEVQETLLTASSALRGLRTGARVLASQRERGPDGSKPNEGDGR